MSYRADIDNLLGFVDQGIWKDNTINGIQYDLYPWHGYSAISIQTRSDSEYDLASWKYFECSKSNGKNLKEEFEHYNSCHDRITYHSMLLEAADQLLRSDLTRFGVNTLTANLGLNRLFLARVFDPDRTFSFNYCEFVVASSLIKA